MTEEPGASPKEKWYLKKSSVITAFLLFGPLALPLVWINPKYSKMAKIITTAAVIVVSYFLLKLFWQSLETMKSMTGSYEELLK